MATVPLDVQYFVQKRGFFAAFPNHSAMQECSDAPRNGRTKLDQNRQKTIIA
jgi:hypothetical protein